MNMAEQGEPSINVDDIADLLADNSFTSDMKVNTPMVSPSAQDSQQKSAFSKSPISKQKRRKPQIKKKIDLTKMLYDLPTIEEQTTPTSNTPNNTIQEAPIQLQNTRISNNFSLFGQYIENYLNSSLCSLKNDFITALLQILEEKYDYVNLLSSFLPQIKNQIREELVLSLNPSQKIDLEASLVNLNAKSLQTSLKNLSYNDQEIQDLHGLINGYGPFIDQFQEQIHKLDTYQRKLLRCKNKMQNNMSNIEILRARRIDLEIKLANLESDIENVKNKQEKIINLRTKTGGKGIDEENSMIGNENYDTSESLNDFREFYKEISTDSMKLLNTLSSVRREYDYEVDNLISSSSNWLDSLIFFIKNATTPPQRHTSRKKPRNSVIESSYDESFDVYSSLPKSSSHGIIDFSPYDKNVYYDRRMNTSELLVDDDDLYSYTSSNFFRFQPVYANQSYV